MGEAFHPCHHHPFIIRGKRVKAYSFSTQKHQECIDITSKIVEIVKKEGTQEGFCLVFVPHATAAIIINENDDPNIQTDFLEALNKVIPTHGKYLHDRIDGNAQSHLIASILGPSEAIPISQGKLQLGRWQAVMFVELDGPRSHRNVYFTIIQ